METIEVRMQTDDTHWLSFCNILLSKKKREVYSSFSFNIISSSEKFAK